MESAMLNVRRFWLRSQAILLARLYTATKDVKYAKKAGVIIKHFAEIFPEIPVHGHDSMGKQDPIFYDVKIVSQPGKVQPVPEPFGHSAKKGYKSPYPYQSTRSGFGTRWVYDEVPLLLIYAYDQIADTLDAKSRKMIEEYSRQSVNYCRTFPRYLSNMDYLIAQWETVCGRVIGEPEFVHGGVIRIRKMFEFAHYPDGVWFEGAPYYAATVVRHLNLALESLEGYKDPEGFVGIEDKNTFAPLDFSPLLS